MKRGATLLSLLFVLFTSGLSYSGGPMINLEGVGGGGLVPGAYLLNPPGNDKQLGTPAIAQWCVLGVDSNMYSSGIGFSFLDRLEVGYAHVILDYNRIRSDIQELTGDTMDPGEDFIHMNVFHLKTVVINEGEYNPAFAVTTEFKFNETIDDINNNIGNALDIAGYDDDFGIDFDFTFSKTITSLVKYPVLVHANLRLTRGAQHGLFGFSDDYTANVEIYGGVCIRPNFIIGGEYRQKPDEYSSLAYALPGFTLEEDDAWNIHIGYLPTENLTIAIAYLSFGNAANKERNYGVVNLKYDF